VPTRRLSVDEPIPASVLTQTEDLLVKPQRSSQVAHREIDMRKTVGLNHLYLVPRLSSTLAIAMMVFQLRVVAGTPKSRSNVPR
jgi:hypothetical protein